MFSNIFLVQVLSRLHLTLFVWPVIFRLATVSQLLLIGVWSLSEFCRYPYYIHQLLFKNSKNRILTFIRYSSFIVLYPLGITCEIINIFKALPMLNYDIMPSLFHNSMLHRSGLLTMRNLYYLILLFYIPGSIYLYNHMLMQRKKALEKL